MRRLYEARGLHVDPNQVRVYWERLGRSTPGGCELFTDSELDAAFTRALEQVNPSFGIVSIETLLRFAKDARPVPKFTAAKREAPAPAAVARFGQAWREALAGLQPAPETPRVRRPLGPVGEPATDRTWTAVGKLVARLVGPR